MKYPDYIPPASPITVKSVYGYDNPVIPCTWEATSEFRPVTKGEKFLDRLGGIDEWPSNMPSTNPYIAVCKIKRIVFMYLRTGKARKGDWYNSANGNEIVETAPMYWWGSNHESSYEHRIYKRTEEE